MAKEEQTRKNNQELVERAWSIVKKTGTATLITVDGHTPIARPMSAHEWCSGRTRVGRAISSPLSPGTDSFSD